MLPTWNVNIQYKEDKHALYKMLKYSKSKYSSGELE